MPVSEEWIHALPKTDLHCHLDGSMRIETILDIAEKCKISLPADSPDGLRKLLVCGEHTKSLEDYLKAFDITLLVLQTEDALRRAAYELVADVTAENVWYIEVRFSPILHTSQGLSLGKIVEAVLDGLKDGEKQFGTRTGLILCGMRHMSPRITKQLAELCIAYRYQGVVGFDLAGAEDEYPAKDHREAFYLVLDNNINCTIHAGETSGPSSIHQALHYCGAHRIGHGTNLKEDGGLLNYVNDHRIPLEICLTSNLHTKSIDSIASHPLRFFYDYGLRVTVNTDNRLMSDTTLTKELALAASELNFTESEIRDLIIFGFKSAFIHYRTRVTLLNEALRRLAEIKVPAMEDKL
jgi:adenosine deaminase